MSEEVREALCQSDVPERCARAIRAGVVEANSPLQGQISTLQRAVAR